MAAGTTSQDILARLTGLHPMAIDLSLERVHRLMAAIGHPERRLPPVVHVAGTNGKGSVVAYLRAMLEAAGYAVHVYTSPHLVDFNERIRLAGRPIDDERLRELLDRVEKLNAGAPITFFEITTAAAFLAFAETPADAVLLETGMGGRLDATNVVARPALTAITPISFDHMQYLGHTLAAIAGEKAGIMKAGVPCVLGPQPPEAAEAFATRAKALGVPIHRHGLEWTVEAKGRVLEWNSGATRHDFPLPGLPGVHQIGNAGTAIAGAERLAEAGFAIGADAMARGLAEVEWPARLQRLTEGPFVAVFPPRAEVWLDGGHNPAAGVALAATFRAWRAADASPRPFYMLAGMLKTKDASGFFAPFAGVVDAAAAAAIPGEDNSFGAAELAAAAAAAGLVCTPVPSPLAGMAALARRAGAEAKTARFLIAGSLYLAGHVLARTAAWAATAANTRRIQDR